MPCSMRIERLSNRSCARYALKSLSGYECRAEGTYLLTPIHPVLLGAAGRRTQDLDESSLSRLRVCGRPWGFGLPPGGQPARTRAQLRCPPPDKLAQSLANSGTFCKEWQLDEAV